MDKDILRDLDVNNRIILKVDWTVLAQNIVKKLAML
jgi:hypothetical protein